MKKWSWLVAPAIVMTLVALPAHAQGGKTTDKIWVIGSGGAAAATSVSLRYGDTFSAGWQSKLANPFGLAQCWTFDAAGNKTGAPFWAAWGRLQADGTIGIFEFASVDPNQVWPARGGSCTVSLVSLQGNKQTVTATSAEFSVAP
jgi:hypothetical protein